MASIVLNALITFVDFILHFPRYIELKITCKTSCINLLLTALT